MNENIEKLIIEYENNLSNSQIHKSYINTVREYNGYIFKEVKNIDRFENELKWLKKLMDLNYYDIPKLVGTYNNKIIITKKINGKVISDNDAREHLYNIGQLLANLHMIKVDSELNVDWKKIIIEEYLGLKELSKNIMEKDIFDVSTEFLNTKLKALNINELAIIHKDFRPENIIYSDGIYYLLDLESMNIGDSNYDFTRILNLLNQKEIYQYIDFKNLIDGYKSINKLEISEEKWQIYNKFYAFRMYSKMLAGQINRDNKFEIYLKSILNNKNDRVTEWIQKYNNESRIKIC